MRKLAILAITAVALMGLATTASAQGQYELGIFFDQAATQPEGDVPGLAAPTRLYVLFVNLGAMISGYELSVDISGPSSAEWTVTRGNPQGLDVDPSLDGYVVGIGVCAGSIGGTFQITTYDMAYFSGTQGPMDTQLCIGSSHANPSIPGFPTFQRCGGMIVEPAGIHARSECPAIGDGCAVINPTNPGCVVATEAATFGAIKAKY